MLLTESAIILSLIHQALFRPETHHGTGKNFKAVLQQAVKFMICIKKTAAHKILPFGTYVKVINLDNNKYTVVKINDRGPFADGRIIDLSYSAAKDILLIGPGVAKVKVTALGKKIGEAGSNGSGKALLEDKNLDKGDFTIQVGAFKNRNNAVELADRLKVLFDYVNIAEAADENNGPIFRLHISKSNTLTEAEENEKKLKDMGFKEAFIVRI